MSLPAGQQRILDGIAETLRSTEPRLTAMFALFTRLYRHDPAPVREQLAAAGLLAALRRLLPDRRTRGGRRRWRVLILGQLTLALVALVVLIGLNAPGGRYCGSSQPARAVAGSPARSPQCSAQVGLGVDMPGK